MFCPYRETHYIVFWSSSPFQLPPRSAPLSPPPAPCKLVQWNGSEGLMVMMITMTIIKIILSRCCLEKGRGKLLEGNRNNRLGMQECVALKK